MTLGQKIKKLRIEKGLTQRDLADQIHVTFQTVSKWENDENEPDVSTLRELAKLFGCSLDFLLSEEEIIERPRQVVIENPKKEEAKELEPVSKTIIIHQKEMHVCARCKKDIPEGDLEIDRFCVSPYRRGRPAEYRDDYYHKECLKLTKKEREEQARIERSAKAQKARKICFGWSIAGGAVALLATLLCLLLIPACKETIHPGVAVAISIGASYGIFSMLYCIICGSYIGEVFVWCASLSIRFPGLIFSWDLEGFAWLIVMKILFAVLGFFIGVLALMFAVGLSSLLGAFSFPFVLVHNENTFYDNY